MKASLSILLLAVALGSAAVLHAQVLSDDFSSLNTAKWTQITSSGTASTNVSVSGGLLNLKNTSASASQRSYLLSQETDLDPFAQSLTFTFSGLTLIGTPTGAHTTGDSIGFYAMVGLSADTAHYYVGATTAPDDYLAFQLLSFTDGYQLKVFDYSGATVNQITYNLAGAPTDIAWTINGAADTYSFSLSGTTFSTTGLSTQSGTIVNFNEAGLGTTPASRLAIGVVNGNALTAGSQASLDGVSVNAVPEPRSVALLLLGAGALLWTLRRRVLGPIRA